MRWPTSLKIGAHTYTIVYCDIWREGEPIGEKYGETLRESETIYINSSLPDTHKFATLIHEILHGLNSELDHTLLDSLAEQLAQVFWDNEMVDED